MLQDLPVAPLRIVRFESEVCTCPPLVRAGFTAVPGLMLLVPLAAADTGGDQVPFQHQIVARRQWTADAYPPPGTWSVGDAVVVVEPLRLPDPCHRVDVEVRRHVDRQTGTAGLTVSLGRPYFVLRPGEACAAVIADVYAVVTIPGHARDATSSRCG